jgi:hypothetical protein
MVRLPVKAFASLSTPAEPRTVHDFGALACSGLKMPTSLRVSTVRVGVTGTYVGPEASFRK